MSKSLQLGARQDNSSSRYNGLFLGEQGHPCALEGLLNRGFAHRKNGFGTGQYSRPPGVAMMHLRPAEYERERVLRRWDQDPSCRAPWSPAPVLARDFGLLDPFTNDRFSNTSLVTFNPA